MATRPHRRKVAKFAPFQRQRERIDAKLRANIRDCCLTSRFKPHVEDCPRAPRGCRDKVGFSDRGLAVRREKAIRFDAGAMSVYRCGSCGLWHLGHDGPGTAP